uniref:Meprin and TRAF homology domain-containing protein / MATH domain-containing protein n=1 Tax=Solanum tuberosum TaxID=4113 RepID=M1DQI4_SOLTU
MEKSRDASSPTRYLLKIESFSLLSENGIYKYESNEFESGGFNWKMIIHPEGEGEGDGDGHISVYLAIIEKSAVWEVNASFSFLIFDQIHDNYTVMKGMERRFRNIKNEWGFSKCISHKTFKDPSNGYLVNDKCVFGVDVYVIKNQGIGECMSLMNGTRVYKHEWKITEFTKLKKKVYSEEFTVGDYKWKLSLYPTGDIQQNGKNISIFLVSVDANGFDRQKRVKANFTISLKNRFDGEHHKFSGGAHWYSAAANSWGWSSFMGCCELNDPKNGFLIEDCCIVEAEVSVVGVVNCLT